MLDLFLQTLQSNYFRLNPDLTASRKLLFQSRTSFKKLGSFTTIREQTLLFHLFYAKNLTAHVALGEIRLSFGQKTGKQAES